jgi:3-oxoacyl-[acyl-carrier protein] reductase
VSTTTPAAGNGRRLALVTGGSGGIGAAVCRRLAADGCHVVVHYARNGDATRTVADRIVADGGAATPCHADLASPAAIEAMIDSLCADHGMIDVLVKCAGIARDSLLASMSDEDLESVIDLNVTGALRVTRAACRQMIVRRRGVIINVSSIAAKSPDRGQSNCAASKAALEGFTRPLAVELGAQGIRVNAVAPGIIETTMTADVRCRHGDALRRRIMMAASGCRRRSRVPGLARRELRQRPCCTSTAACSNRTDPMPDRDVVVSGLGIVSPVGIGTRAFWASVTAARTGIEPWDDGHASDPIRVAARVRDFDAAAYIRGHAAAAPLQSRVRDAGIGRLPGVRRMAAASGS